MYKETSFLERISDPKIDFLVKTQQNTRTKGQWSIYELAARGASPIKSLPDFLPAWLVTWKGTMPAVSPGTPAIWTASTSWILRSPVTAVPGKPSHRDILQVTVSRIPCAGRPGSQDWLPLEMTMSKWPGRIRRQGLSQETSSWAWSFLQKLNKLSYSWVILSLLWTACFWKVPFF